LRNTKHISITTDENLEQSLNVNSTTKVIRGHSKKL